METTSDRRAKVPSSLRNFTLIATVVAAVLSTIVYYFVDRRSGSVLWVSFGAAIGLLGTYIFALRTRPLDEC